MFGIYCITGGRLSRSGNVLYDIEQMCLGRAKFIQLREKELSRDELFDVAKQALQIMRHFGAKLIINDDVELALRLGADGVHLGENDRSIFEARAVLGDQVLIGYSFSDISRIDLLRQMPIDYIGCGAVFATPTKPEKTVIGLAGLAEMVKLSPVPVVAIGGIGRGNFDDVMACGVDGVAMVRAIAASEDVRSEVEFFVRRFEELRNSS